MSERRPGEIALEISRLAAEWPHSERDVTKVLLLLERAEQEVLEKPVSLLHHLPPATAHPYQSMKTELGEQMEQSLRLIHNAVHAMTTGFGRTPLPHPGEASARAAFGAPLRSTPSTEKIGAAAGRMPTTGRILSTADGFVRNAMEFIRDSGVHISQAEGEAQLRLFTYISRITPLARQLEKQIEEQRFGERF